MSNQVRIEFGFGIGEDRDGNAIQSYDRILALRLIALKAIELFDGYTLYRAVGGWKNPQGRAVEELGGTLLIYAPKPMLIDEDKLLDKITSLGTTIKESLRQQSVYITRQDIELTEL